MIQLNLKYVFPKGRYKVSFLLCLFYLLILEVPSADSSFLDWFWGGDRENVDMKPKIGDVPNVKVPFEVTTEDVKFLEEAKKYTSLKLSDLDSCQHQIVMKIRNSCVDMTEEELAKLSVNLLNCQSAVEGRQQFPCTSSMSLRECTSSMDSDMWNTYHLMNNRARAVCYAARHQQFRAMSEMTVNKLMDTAHNQLDTMNSLKFSRKMTERIEQRYCIKFCQKLGDSQSQTIRKIQQVFGEDAMGVTQIKEWFNRFKDGRTSAESEQRCGRPQTARSAAVVERVRNLVMADHRLTVREIAEEVGVSKDSAHAILRDDLNMNRVAAKFVPKLLSPEQKDLRCDVAQDLLDTANTDPGFLNTVITGDESWVYGYDPETKRQSSQWKHPESPRPKKVRQVRSKIKVMLTVFFDVRGIVHHEYASEGQTVTKEHVDGNNWHLHHDNAPAHSSQLIHTFLAKHGITTVRQPPYSPEMAPCDFWLFPKLKTLLKGSRFESREEIMRNATTELNTIPKEDFQRCFRQWKDRWAKCVQAQGAYFEGDYGHNPVSSSFEGQKKLESITSNTMESISQGHQSLMDQQEKLRVTQRNIQDFVTLNLRELTREKALIAAGHRELAKMTEDVKKKLDEASMDLSNQVNERRDNHKQLLQDLESIQAQAALIWERIDESTQQILAQHASAAAQYESTLHKLAQINTTVNFLLNLMDKTRHELDERLGWLTRLLGGTGEQVDRLYSCVLHILFLVVGMITAAFVRAPTLTRTFLLLVVPLNLAVTYHHGDDAALNFPSMTILILASTAVHWMIQTILHYWSPKQPVSMMYLPPQPMSNGFVPTPSPTKPPEAVRSHIGMLTKLKLSAADVLKRLN
ncbi:hypothetical protein ANN_27320, partial [Periplaneta americana]